MNQSKLLVPIVLCAILLSSMALGQGTDIKLSGQVRQRSEMSGKDFADSTEVSSATVQRTRLNLSFTTAAGDQAFLQVQDTRTHGSETSTLTDGSADMLDIHQAYFLIKNVGGKSLSVKIGRMELAFGNQRLVGAVGWHNIARAFDGTQFTYSKGNIKADAFYMKEVEAGAAGNVGDKDFRGVWIDSKWSIPGLVNSTNIDGFFLNQKQDETFNVNTVGIFSKGSYGLVGGIKLTQEIDFALQSGALNDSTNMNASLIGVRVGLVLGGMAIKPSIGVGYDLVSGNDPTTSDNEAFNTLYATNHKFYGFMDYFLNVPVHAKGYGLQDILLSGGIVPSKGIALNFAYHMFTTPQAVSLDSVDVNDLGTELDFTASFAYRPGIKIVGGYSIFTPGVVFKAWKGMDPASWGYLMVITNF